MKDDWRYIGVGEDTWKLNRFSKCTEDNLIAQLDGDDPPPPEISGIEMIANLSEKRKHIIYLHVWEGMSFSAIAELYGISKQAIHQQYKKAIKDLKKVYPNKESLLESNTSY
jgi:DNA-directed RNA polymerase specialized sigma24 family protein